MTKALPTNPGEHRVRIVFRGGFAIHVITSSPPEFTTTGGHRFEPVSFDVIENHSEGDTIAAIDWAEVAAVSYR